MNLSNFGKIMNNKLTSLLRRNIMIPFMRGLNHGNNNVDYLLLRNSVLLSSVHRSVANLPNGGLV